MNCSQNWGEAEKMKILWSFPRNVLLTVESMFLVSTQGHNLGKYQSLAFDNVCQDKTQRIFDQFDLSHHVAETLI